MAQPPPGPAGLPGREMPPGVVSFLQQVCPTGMISCTLQVRRPRPGWGLGALGARTPPGGERFQGACPRGQGTHPEVSAVAHVEGLEELLWAGHLYPLFTQPGRAETR